MTPLAGHRVGRVVVLPEERIAVRRGNSIHVIEIGAIRYLRTARNLTTIVTTDGEVQARESMQSVLAKLHACGLVQIHRAVAINFAKVSQLTGRGSHKLTVTLDEEEFEVGREFQQVIRLRFGAGTMRVKEPATSQPGVAERSA